jgi:hypothetical protein
MAKRLALICAGFVSLIFAPVESQTPTIVAREVSGSFYSDGVMKPEAPTFEFVFEVRDSAIIRRSVHNLQSGKIEVDDTRYEILKDVASYNPEALGFRKLTASERRLAPVIRAIGHPGSDAVEILFVGPDWVQSVKTIRDYMVISRCVRKQ